MAARIFPPASDVEYLPRRGGEIAHAGLRDGARRESFEAREVTDGVLKTDASEAHHCFVRAVFIGSYDDQRSIHRKQRARPGRELSVQADVHSTLYMTVPERGGVTDVEHDGSAIERVARVVNRHGAGAYLRQRTRTAPVDLDVAREVARRRGQPGRHDAHELLAEHSPESVIR